MNLCDYGCGREAKYQFKNGKWCCSKYFSSCPEMRRKNGSGNRGRIGWAKGLIKENDERVKKNSEAHLGKYHTEKSKRLMSKKNSGENNGFYGKKHTEETKQKIREKRAVQKGPICPNWQGGISKLPYAPDWGDKSKRESF